jgi:hypothetical protein
MAHEDALHHQDHASADDEYAATPPGSTYEHTDANVWPIVKFLFWLAASAVVIHFGLGLIYEVMIRQSIELEQPYPLARGREGQVPPAPRLQQFPENEIYQFRLGEEQLLTRYGWMNRETGVVHIPIEQAMRLTIERGMLQSVTPDPTQPAVVPGMLPSDASSGRTLERRRQ